MDNSVCLEKLPATALDVFRTRYLAQQRPVVLKGLFRGQPVANLDTRDKVVKALGAMRFRVFDEYSSRWGSPKRRRRARMMSLTEYLSYVRQNPHTAKLCTEYPLPAEVRALFTMPPQCDGTDPDGQFNLFVANAGNRAHLHFDGDYRHVLLYQVWGDKRVVVIPPPAAKKLFPMGNFSAIYLEHMTDAERLAFIKYVGGYEVVLKPSEAIFIPATWWHYVQYLENGVAFNIRFGRSHYGTFLAEHFAPTMYLQNIGAKLVDPARADREYPGVIRRIKRAMRRRTRPDDPPYVKTRELGPLFRRLYAEMCPEAMQAPYCAIEVPELYA